MALLTALAVADPKPVRELNPDMPAALAELVMRLLAKKPADRPASAQEVVDQLAAIEKNPQGVQANRTPAAVRPKSSRRRAVRRRLSPSPNRVAAPRSTRSWGRRPLLIAAARGRGLCADRPGYAGNQNVRPGVKVSVEQDGDQVDVLDAQSKQQLSIRSGKYTLRLTGGDGSEHEMVLDHGTNPVTLTRGGKVVVTVKRVEKPVDATAPAVGTAKSAFPPLDEAWAKTGRGAAGREAGGGGGRQAEGTQPRLRRQGDAQGRGRRGDGVDSSRRTR